jgi:hypothetical protein
MRPVTIKFILLAAVLLFTGSLHCQQKDTVIVKGIHSHDSLLNLFPGGTVKGKAIEWKPAEKDKVLYKDVISKSGLCYTQYQHVLNLEKVDTYVFFRTDRFSPGEFSGPENYRPIVGIAHLRRSAQGLKLVKFQPHVLKLADSYDEGYMRYTELDFPTVKYERRLTGPGESGTIVDYYDLKGFKKLFSVITFESNELKVESGAPGYFERSSSVSSLDKNTVEIYTHVIRVDKNGEIKEEYRSKKIKIYDPAGKVISGGVYR